MPTLSPTPTPSSPRGAHSFTHSLRHSDTQTRPQSRFPLSICRSPNPASRLRSNSGSFQRLLRVLQLLDGDHDLLLSTFYFSCCVPLAFHSHPFTTAMSMYAISETLPLLRSVPVQSQFSPRLSLWGRSRPSPPDSPVIIHPLSPCIHPSTHQEAAKKSLKNCLGRSGHDGKNLPWLLPIQPHPLTTAHYTHPGAGWKTPGTPSVPQYN